MAEDLAHHGASASAYAALGGSPGAGVLPRIPAGGIAGRSIGAYAHIAHHHVEEHGRRHQRNPAHADTQAGTLLFQPAHGPCGCVQPPGAAAGQHDAVDLLHQIAGVQQIGLARARGCAAHIYTAHGTLGAQHGGAARGAKRVAEMADGDALHTADMAFVCEQILNR